MNTADIAKIANALADAKTRLRQAELRRDDVAPANYEKDGISSCDIQVIHDEIGQLEKALEEAGGYIYSL